MQWPGFRELMPYAKAKKVNDAEDKDLLRGSIERQLME